MSKNDIYEYSSMTCMVILDKLTTVPEMQKNSLLEVNNINFFYNKRKDIIKNLNFKLFPSEIVGISGENGAGKSTFLKLLVGILKPRKGNIIKNGILGYSPQNILLFDNLTVLENFRVFGKGLNLSQTTIEEKTSEILDILQFKQYKDTFVKDLSGGTAQKTNFGISLLGDPDILVLDEPYQGLDYSSFTAFWEIQFKLRKLGKSIIIVSHLIEDQSKFTRSLHLINKKLQSCDKQNCSLGCEN
ncbi:MAG: ABC-type transporter ATP-binding protein EcsA [Candidatus Heimdallarchaeota archaeon LC_2]|nr:MAG: ABC-type transporter ATP-binding protein EcsA [Candidatus Heimdallarchaeota archaeon LC_2]